LYHSNRGYFIAWQIDGFFYTQKGIDYLNDMIARIILTLRECKPERLIYKPNTKQELAHYYPKIYKLKELQKAKSLTAKAHAPRRAEALDDYCFWAIKLYTEDSIRIFGEGIVIPYSQIEEWAFAQFIDYKKGRSTVRAKARSVWNWYDEHDWLLPKGYKRKFTDEEYQMTRTERARSNAKARADKARKAVINAITGLYADEYKKKSGAWHIGKISKVTRVHRDTVSKYLKQYEEEK